MRRPRITAQYPRVSCVVDLLNCGASPPAMKLCLSLTFADLTPILCAYLWGMNSITLFGLFAVTAMLIFYALEDRSSWFILAFAGACALGAVYGFLQGAWPFGLVETIWTGVAIWRWRKARIDPPA